VEGDEQQMMQGMSPDGLRATGGSASAAHTQIHTHCACWPCERGEAQSLSLCGSPRVGDVGSRVLCFLTSYRACPPVWESQAM